MTVDFNDYFWGEKNNGFDVLYHNMKYGFQASKEFSEFLRERSNVEENNSKLFAKLAKQAGSCCAHGTFAPVWHILKNSAEKLSALHMQMVQKVSDLVKEVTKYSDDLQKKHKTVKEEEEGTLRKVQAMQAITLAVQKSKEALNQRGIELEKLRKENASPKEIEKAEQKLKKAQEDHKNFIEKYTTTKEEFEKRMCVTCKNFQDLEVSHLVNMKEFLNSYVDVVDWTHEEMGKVHAEFRQQCIELTVDQLLEQFVRDKSTGLERPGVMNLEESMLPVTSPTQEVENSKTRAKREGFLRSRRDKAKQKKSKKKAKDGADNQSNKDEKSDMDEKEEPQPVVPAAPIEASAPELDDEGYVIRPNPPHNWNTEKGSFYSSSDSDSDDERERKIHVEIKPLSHPGAAPMSASVDELRATVENLYLSPVGSTFGRRGSNLENQDLMMKRSQSVSQQIGKPSSDLLGLNFVQSPTASNASTPTSSHPYAPLQSPSQLALNSPTLSVSSRYPELGDLFSEDVEASNVSNKPIRQTPTPTSGYMSIPRPPSRRSDPSKNLVSQNTISRTDSINSLEFRTAVGASRGPSPLTIGMSDTMPLAIAFHEMIHAYFRGSDEARCQVKMSGEMMLSFPAGLISMLTNNPNPSKLIFHIKNTQRLLNILPNRKLVSIDNGQSSDILVIEFNMNALSNLLKKHVEENPVASFFNIDILKYRIKPNPGASSCPLHLVAYWKCTKAHTDMKMDYKYNSHAMASPSPLLNVTVSVPVKSEFKKFNSKPEAKWNAKKLTLDYKFTEISQHTENDGVGSLLARIDLGNSGPSVPTTIEVVFSSEGTTLSGIDFQLVGTGYRISLVKRRLVSGRYICDGDEKFNSGGATPSTGSAAPSVASSSGEPNC